MVTQVAIVFLSTILIYAASLKVFPVLGLLDFPERYGLKRARLPYPAGIVAIIVFLGAFVITTDIGRKELGLIAAVLLLGTVCFFDDRTPLPSSVRLAVQVVCAMIVFLTGSQIYTITNPLGGIIKLDSIIMTVQAIGPIPVLSGVFTLVWLLFTINALNWLDGITGQVSALSTVGFLMLGCLAYFRNGEIQTAQIAFTLATISGAGLLFDFPPGKMLIGDSGSMFFGLMLGLLGIFSVGKVATVFLALGIPLLDAVFVIIRRISHGKSPFKGGRDHLHHLLLARGWSERQVILLMTGAGTAFGIAALFLSTGGKAALGIALILLMLLLYRRTSKKMTNAQ
jgi:UDP-GlcNAc:undecaprenyl-phosphate GlcNAc-1-phosphate transferase